MQLKSILNRIQKHSAYVYETVRLMEDPELTLEVRVRPRRGTRATCSHCRRPAPGYDTLPPRRFDFVPLWHIPVVFVYAMRRTAPCGHVKSPPGDGSRRGNRSRLRTGTTRTRLVQCVNR